jgi:ribulose-5-phosphate 4-epimerase/fuculose-1-phosphate aldolase
MGEEERVPLVFTIKERYGLAKRPPNLLTVVNAPRAVLDRTLAEMGDTIPAGIQPAFVLQGREGLSKAKRAERAEPMVRMGRREQAYHGSPRILLVVGDEESRTIEKGILFGLEGSHPSISGEDEEGFFEELSRRLWAFACAKDADHMAISEGAISREAWERSAIPEQIIAAGHRMDELGLLAPPVILRDLVSNGMARVYERYFNLKRMSEGNLSAWEPDLGVMVITGTGSVGVDKRHLQREHLVPVGELTENGVVVWQPEGTATVKPSVEAMEQLAIYRAAPQILLRDERRNVIADSHGTPVTVPAIRALLHTHVGITAYNPELVEVVHIDRERFPYPFSCGTDLLARATVEAFSKARAFHNPDGLPRAVLLEQPNHGIVVAELWRDPPAVPCFEATLDLFAAGEIEWTYAIPQV